MEEEEIQHIPDRKTGWVVESAQGLFTGLFVLFFFFFRTMHFLHVIGI